MKAFRLLPLFAAALIALGCNNASENAAPSVKKQEAPVGFRSYFDVYGPVKTIQFELPDGSLSELLEFDEKGMNLQMLNADKDYLELNELTDNESTIKIDDQGRLNSFGIEGFIELKYDGKYIIEEKINPSDLGPAYSPHYYVYDANGDRVAQFQAKLVWTPQLDEKYKDNMEYMICDEDILNCIVERYIVTNWDSHGNWIERKVFDNQGEDVKIEKRTITYFE